MILDCDVDTKDTNVVSEMQKVIKIAEIDFWPTQISTQKWPENDPK